MEQQLRILLVEDSESDAELLLRELRRGGYQVTALRVDSQERMMAALEEQSWDIIISDYVIPGFGGLEALSLFRTKGLGIPFIVVSGHIGEELAVAAMQAGADDYLMKDRMARLVPAVKRALSEAETRRAHRRADAALKESEERFRQLAENIAAVFFLFERPTAASPGALAYVSPAFNNVWGISSQAVLENPVLWVNAIHPEERASLSARLGEMASGNFAAEFRVVHMGTKVRWVHFRAFPIHDANGAVYRIAAVAEDISERKGAEQRLAENTRQLRDTVEELQRIEEELRSRNDELSEAREELEKRVRQRTAALATANSELQDQMQERKRLENELLEIAENERRRIGFDLHDDLGQKLMGISLLLKALETNLAHKRAPEAAETRKVQTLIHQVINHTHNLARCFSSLEPEGEDLCSQLKKFAASVCKTFHIRCQFRAMGSVPALPAESALQFYKIAQESVSNAIKHGKAKRVSILLARRGAQIILRIKNDGLPIQSEREPSNRLGLRIMNYRAHLAGGTFEIKPNGNSGSLVTCTITYVNGSKLNGSRAGTSTTEFSRADSGGAGGF